MEHTYRPQLSRETRLLLITAALALAVLWLLARLRFPGGPVAPDPVTPLLTQLSARTVFEDLSAAIAEAHDALAAQLDMFDGAAAFPLGNGRGLAWLPQPAAARPRDQRLVAVEPWSGLAVVDTSTAGQASPAWSPASPELPRYLIASDTSGARLAFRPVYIATMDQTDSAVSDVPVWSIPSSTSVAPGTFLFTVDRQLAGLVLPDAQRLIVVPGSALAALADRIVEDADIVRGDLGIQVQPLTGRVADAAGTDAGVIVTRVEQVIGSTATLAPGDVIQAIDGKPVASVQHWTAKTARVRAGAVVTLRVRRGDGVHDVPVTAPAPPGTPAPRLGLMMRGRGRNGTEIMRVERGAAGDRAGLRVGDVLTRLADVAPPSPADITRAFANASAGQPLLVAVTRGTAHWITTLEK